LPILPVLGIIFLAIAAIGTWKRYHQRLLLHPFNWGLALFGCWLLLTSGFAFKQLEALAGTANFLPFLIIFPAFSRLLRSPSRLRQLAWAIALPSLLVVALGLGQLFAGWGDFPILKQLGINVIPYGRPEGRMSSLFMYANTLAAYLLIAFILGLGLGIDAFRNWRRENCPLHRRQILLSVSVVISAGIGLILANSRNAWGIALCACLAFALYLGWRWLVVGIVAAAGSVGWAAWGPSAGRERLRQVIPAFFWTRLADELYERPLATLRSTQWQFAWEMAQERPWLGWGLRNFTPLYKAEMGLWLGHPHNLFLMLLAEIGIPATLFLCGLVAWVVVRGIGLLVNLAQPLGKVRYHRQRNQLLLFTYLLAFGGCTAFNLFDVTIFDIRLNLLGWILLAAINGEASQANNRIVIYREPKPCNILKSSSSK
jgi:O-antigen ligase